VQQRGVPDQLFRFCFQCGKLEPLEFFEGDQRCAWAWAGVRVTAAAHRTPQPQATRTHGCNPQTRHTLQHERMAHT
jgi:hypothetical protein